AGQFTVDATGHVTATSFSGATTGITNLIGDVTATGPGSVYATVVSINGVPIPAIAPGTYVGLVLVATSPTVATWVNAGPLNIGNSLVRRDSSGNFNASTITATLNGNASTVTTNANLIGNVTS